jgi:late competence protein required for DNA uptake (superfamily II DNA/RNA helicase)
MNKWLNFEFNTCEKLASIKGTVCGMVNTITGEITASQHFGLMNYRDTYNLNVSDKVNPFPYTTEDRIILAARQTIKDHEQKVIA